MQYLTLCLIFFLSSLQASEVTSAGEWSAPVQGLRGRLVSSEVKPAGGTRIAHLYLELENVSDGTNPLLLVSHTPKVEVTDAAGKVLHQVGPSMVEETSSPPYTIALPLDATIRVRISVGGWKVWIIPSETGEERYLIGAFVIPERKLTDIKGRQKDHHGGTVWRGTLNLPKLKLPTSLK